MLKLSSEFGVFIMCLCTKVTVCSASVSSVIGIEPDAKCRPHSGMSAAQLRNLTQQDPL